MPGEGDADGAFEGEAGDVVGVLGLFEVGAGLGQAQFGVADFELADPAGRRKDRQMSKQEDRILARELAKLGALGGAVGGIGGALGGGLGAGLAARLLPDNVFEFTTELCASPHDVLHTAFGILRKVGRITEAIKPSSDVPTLYAIVGSGFFNLNPALVSVEIAPVSDDSVAVSIRATAKEGLIKQRAGEKAAKRVGELLNKAFSEPESGN